MRYLLISIISFGFLSSSGQSTDTKAGFSDSLIHVTLLGTGTPQPIMDRFGPSILVQAGSENLLFDAGRGCLQRMRQIHVEYKDLTALFFTHLHSDHIVGLPDLWLTGWLISERPNPLPVFGPRGTRLMTTNLAKAYEFDIAVRAGDDKAALQGVKLMSKEISEGLIYENAGVRVIAFLVDHGPVAPAFGYLVKYKGHSVVLSGDTRLSNNLIKFSAGADMLIHEVVIGPDTVLSKTDPKFAIQDLHTTPEQASVVFEAVKPKLAVYSHISRLYGHSTDEIATRTNAHYRGRWVLGEDLMAFTIGDTVAIRPWSGK